MSEQEPKHSIEATKTPDPQSIEGLFLATLGKSTPEEREAFSTKPAVKIPNAACELWLC